MWRYVHMWIYLLVLYKDTANISDCVMLNDWLMSGEWNRKKLIVPWPNWKYCLNILLKWLRKISSTSFRMDRYPADFLNQFPSKSETLYRLSWFGRLQIVKWCEIWRFLDFRSIVGEAYTRFPTFRDRFVVWNIQEGLTQ